MDEARTVKWGVLSTAKIGVVKVIPGLAKASNCEVVGLASRERSKAEKVVADLGLSKAYGSYEELLADPDIDAIYNPLPNHLHVDWSIKALEAGKHVLCEKPLGVDANDARRLVEAAERYPKLKVMEAFMYRFNKQWIEAKAWVDAERIGALRTIQSFFSYYNVDPADIRNQSDIGGGALLDIGCYCISLSRFLFGERPGRVMGIVERDPVMKIDRLASGVMEFETGTSSFTCSTQIAPYQRVQIVGTVGRIEIEIPFNAPNDRETRIWLHGPEGTEEVAIPICDQYTQQGEAFAAAALEDRPVPTALSDAIDNMETIDAIFESGETNAWIAL